MFAFAVDIHRLHIWLYKLLIESLFINSLISQVIAVILAACYYLLNKQENVDNQTESDKIIKQWGVGSQLSPVMF